MNSSAEAAVSVRKLIRTFDGRRVLDDVNLDVTEGTVFALVGPDGAGKSTLIRILCGLMNPDSGDVRVLGREFGTGRKELRRRIGYLSQRFSLYGDLSIDENLAFTAEIFGLRDYRRRRDELLEMTGLTPFRGRAADRLSGGMRQKLALAATLIHNPSLILLDEPTNGVDPVSRREFWKLLRDLGREGITLVMSTPYLDEAERADGVAVLHEGRLLLNGSPGDIRRSWNMDLMEFFCDRNREAVPVLERAYAGSEAQAFGDRVHLVVPEGRLEPGEAAKLLGTAGIRVSRYGRTRPGLENVYLSRIREASRG